MGEVQNKYVMNNIPQERKQISHKQALKGFTFSTAFFILAIMFLLMSILFVRDEST